MDSPKSNGLSCRILFPNGPMATGLGVPHSLTIAVSDGYNLGYIFTKQKNKRFAVADSVCTNDLYSNSSILT